MTENREGARRQRGRERGAGRGSPGAPQGRGRWRSQGTRPQGQTDRPRAGSFWAHPSPRSPLLTFSFLAASPPFSVPPFPYNPSAATRFAPAALFEDKKKKKRILVGPRCFLLEQKQLLPLALARERGWFPQLPPGGIWAQGRRLSGPALSQDLGGAEKGARLESEADARRRAGAGGLDWARRRAGTAQTHSGLTPSDNLQLWSRPPRRLKNLRATL